MEDPLKLLMIDGDADTIIDSIVLPWDLAPVMADPLGPRVAVMTAGQLHIYRADVTEPAGVFEVPSTEITFTDERDLMVGSQGGIGCITPPETNLYRLPDMTSEFKDTLPLSQLQVDPERGLVYGLVYGCNAEWTLVRSNFGAYDYKNRRIAKVWKINPDSEGRGYYLIWYHLNAEHRLLYATALTPAGYRLVCYDLDREEIVFEFPIHGGAALRLTPNGQEFWVPNYYGEIISVYDAEDGELLDVISLSGHRPLGIYGATPLQIRFLPSGDKAYVTCGSDTPGPLLVIDVHKREVTKTFFVDELRWPVLLDVGSAPE